MFKNFRVSQEYGRKNTAYRKGYHTGIDLVAIDLDKTIYSFTTGQIIRARFTPGKGADPKGWGNYVIVRSGGHDILYAHLSQVFVKVGQQIKIGDKIGIQGNTGNSTGPHLHLETWKGPWTNRNDINPANYFGIVNSVGNVREVKTVQPTNNTPSSWAKESWEWAKKEGLLDGTRPKDHLTREEFAAVLKRLGEQK